MHYYVFNGGEHMFSKGHLDLDLHLKDHPREKSQHEESVTNVKTSVSRSSLGTMPRALGTFILQM